MNHDAFHSHRIEIALYRHGTEEEYRRLNRFYDVLSQAVVRIRSREELLQTVCRLIVERGAFDLAWIDWLHSETENRPNEHDSTLLRAE